MTETAIRAGSFILVLLIMGAAETRWPRRVLTAPKVRRWISNLSMVAMATFIVRLFFPIVPAGLALFCQKHDLGLLNIIPVPAWFAFLLSVALLDMLIYWQHVIFHRHPLLWRIHRMHHADVNIDASTGIRFHPIEMVSSVLIKLVAILILGPPAMAVITFEVLLNCCALFNHANVRLPLKLDRFLRLIMVTPDMHRVHHSTDMREANMNFGFNLPWWDRLFGTYKAQPDLGHDNMRIGLNIFREPRYISIRQMLGIPFI